MANSYPSVDANTQQAIYNNPQYTNNQANPSSVGKQIRLDVYEKQALLDIVKEQYFSQLADTTDMPKNMRMVTCMVLPRTLVPSVVRCLP